MALMRTLILSSGTNLLRFPSSALLPFQRNFTFSLKKQVPLLHKWHLQNSGFPSLGTGSNASTCSDNEKSHAHHISWIIEKFGSLALLIVIPQAILFPSTPIDIATSSLIAYHHYIGINSILGDYARPSVLGKTGSTLCILLNIITTLAALLGLILFSKNQMCLGHAVRSMWSIKSNEE